jgi:protein subunit release factor B
MADRKPIISLTRENFTWQTFRSGGKGGQHQNKTESGVRCIHEASGARGESREERSQWANKKKAFERCTSHPKMQAWLKTETMRRIYDIDRAVDEAMREENLKIETYSK